MVAALYESENVVASEGPGCRRSEPITSGVEPSANVAVVGARRAAAVLDVLRVPAFIEEVLRLEGPVETDCRLTRVSTSVATVEIPAGTTVTMLLDAANRDPRRIDDPDGARRYECTPTFVLRGLQELHHEFTPAG